MPTDPRRPSPDHEGPTLPEEEEISFELLPGDDETRPITASDKETIELHITLLKRENEQLRTSVKELEKTHSSTASERDRLRESLGRATKMLVENAALIEELKEELQKLTTPPLLYGIVVAYNRDDETADVLVNGQRHRVSVHPRITPEQLKRGARVALNGKTMAIQLSTPNVEAIGVQVQISTVMNERCALIEDSRGDKRIALISDGLTPEMLEPNTPVLLEDGVIVATIEQGTKRGALGAGSRFLLAEMPDVTFDDIGGLDDVIADLVAAIEDPYSQDAAECYAKLGMKKTSSVLFYGTPGNGKTMLAKAIANRQFERHREEILRHARGNFFVVSGTELYEKWLGNTEGYLKSIFEAAKRLHALTGAISTVFFDDCEELFRSRSAERSSGINASIVTTLSGILDGIDPLVGVNFMGATNRLDNLDIAIQRRFDTHIRIVAPDTPDRARVVLRKILRDTPFDTVTAEEGIAQLVDSIFAKTSENALLEVFFQEDDRGDDSEVISLGQLVSGKMLADVVQRAKIIAKDRIKAIPKDRRAYGLTLRDLQEAIRKELSNRESLPTNRDTVTEWLRQRGDKRTVSYVINLRNQRRMDEKRDRKLDAKVV